MRRAPFGMSTGCCMETNLMINFIFRKRKKKKLIIIKIMKFDCLFSQIDLAQNLHAGGGKKKRSNFSKVENNVTKKTN